MCAGTEDEPLSTEQQEHHTVRLYFNVTHIPHHEALKGAELRLFRRRANDSFYNLQNHQDYVEAHPSINKPHRIDIYEVIRPRTETSEAITRLIDTRYMRDLKKSKWESFDIHPAVHRWLGRVSRVQPRLKSAMPPPPSAGAPPRSIQAVSAAK